MSQVTLQVGGRAYPVSCADGEEDHVRRLAAVVDAKLAGLGGNLVPGDAQNLLFAALILADEAEEARKKGATATTPPADDAAARRLDAIADRIEALAGVLENGPATA